MPPSWAGGLLTRLLLIGLAFFAGPFAIAEAQTPAEGVRITLDQGRLAARRALQVGQLEIAEQLALGLLQADPRDPDALIVIAAVAQERRQFRRQADFGSRAYQAADTQIQRFEAAMLTAQAFFALGRYGWSQVWLRLAAEVAPNEAARELVTTNYGQAAQVNPWRNRFTFSISPSTNINNGSRDRILEIGGIPFTLSADARALSGIRARIGFTSRYRYAQTERSESYLRFGLALERVRLTEDSKQEAPDAEGSDFAYDAIEIGWGRIWAQSLASGTHQVDVAFGKNWYGGEPLSDFIRGTYRRANPISSNTLVGATVSLEQQWRLDASVRSALTGRGAIDVTQRLSNGDSVTLVGGLRRVASESIEIDHSAARFGISYFPVRRIGPARIDLQADVEYRDYPESPFSPNGRQDTRWRLGATFGFPDAELYGYFPTLTIESRRVDSNITLYNSEEIGFRVGVRSVF